MEVLDTTVNTQGQSKYIFSQLSLALSIALLSKVVHLCVHLQDLTLQSTVYMYVCMYTVEPPNKGQVGAWATIRGLGSFCQKAVFELYILLVYKLLWSVLEQQ